MPEIPDICLYRDALQVRVLGVVLGAVRLALPGRIGLAAFDFGGGTLSLTEASRSVAPRCTWLPAVLAWPTFDRGGVDPLRCSATELGDGFPETTVSPTFNPSGAMM